MGAVKKMVAAAVAPHDGKVVKQYVISVTINFKRGKEEIEFAHKESERLYNLITTAENEWAKQRIEKIQSFILSGPDAEAIRTELESKLKETDEG